MDVYAANWGKLADEIWKTEYLDKEVQKGTPCPAGATDANPEHATAITSLSG